MSSSVGNSAQGVSPRVFEATPASSCFEDASANQKHREVGNIIGHFT